MYAYIQGQIEELSAAKVVLATPHIGYTIFISLHTYAQIEQKASVRLLIYEHIREDCHDLYGFFTEEERQMFIALLKISGLGVNMARVMLSQFSPAILSEMIHTADTASLQRIKGVGKKMAERIVLELRETITDLLSPNPEAVATLTPVQSNPIQHDCTQALIALGIARNKAQSACQRSLAEHPDASVEQLIRYSLQDV